MFCFHTFSVISIIYELQQDIQIFYSSLAQILIYPGPLTKSHKHDGPLPKIIRSGRHLDTPRDNIYSRNVYKHDVRNCKHLCYVSVNTAHKYNFFE